MINLAIIGAGSIATVLAKTIVMMNSRGDSKVKLYAVGSRSKEKSEYFSKEYGAIKAYGSYDEIYNDPEVDLVYIATPHNFHYEQVKKALEHKKHVLCEKAFTINAKQAQELCDLAKENNVLLCEAIWTRYQPMRQIINDVVASGIIGVPMMVTANLSYSIAHKERLQKPELAGGALLDVGIYALNFANMVLGDPDYVEALCIKNSLGVDMSDSVTFTYEKTGQMAVLCASALAVSDRYGMIHGTNGFIQVENINNPQKLTVFDKEYKVVKEINCPEQLTGYEYELTECAECIEKGLIECPSMPHERTIYMMNLMDSIRAQLAVKYPFE